MAKLTILLCFMVLVVAVLAHGKRHKFFTPVEARPRYYSRLRMLDTLINSYDRQHGSHGALMHHQGGHERPHARAGPAGQGGGMLKAPEHATGSHHMAGRGQGPRRRGHVQGQGRYPGFWEVGRHSRRPYRLIVRSHGRHHLGNDHRGHGLQGRGHHAMRGHRLGGRGHGMGSHGAL